MNRTYRLSDVVNERFLRLPLSLFANPNYKRLSAESKLVYSLLLDRMSLSQKNNWINEDGEVYLIYKREEIADILCITYKKAIAAFKELITAGLLLEKRQGRGFPNRLFVLKCELEDRDATFEDLRQKYEADFPELSDSKTISWTVNYGKTTKSVSNPGSDKVYEIKAEIENSKAFKDALKKAKTDADKNPECTVKAFKKAQSKGEALSGFKEFCLTKADALKTEKPIVLLPSKDGRVYEQRTNEIGRFTAPAENIRELESITPSFESALPKIPAHIFSKIMGFFKSISDELHYEVLVHILYDTEEKEYIIKVPKQRISHVAVNSEAEEPYPERYIHVVDFHSHNTMPAVFSETDNDDEKETRLYAVAGRFDRTFPEITVRAGCAGKFIYLPPEEVFEGNFFGDFPKEWKENIRFAEETPRRIIPHIRRFFGEERI